MHLPLHEPLARALTEHRADLATRRRRARRAIADHTGEPGRRARAPVLPNPFPELLRSRRP